MSIVQFNRKPLWEVDSILKDLFNDFPQNWNGVSTKNSFMPAVNIHETSNQYVIELNAPGRKKEDFHIKVADGLLTVGYEHKEEKVMEERKTIRKEFSYKNFERSFQLDEQIETEGIVAKYESGILQVTLPKKADQTQKAKNISIQ